MFIPYWIAHTMAILVDHINFDPEIKGLAKFFIIILVMVCKRNAMLSDILLVLPITDTLAKDIFLVLYI